MLHCEGCLQCLSACGPNACSLTLCLYPSCQLPHCRTPVVCSPLFLLTLSTPFATYCLPKLEWAYDRANLHIYITVWAGCLFSRLCGDVSRCHVTDPVCLLYETQSVITLCTSAILEGAKQLHITHITFKPLLYLLTFMCLVSQIFSNSVNPFHGFHSQSSATKDEDVWCTFQHAPFWQCLNLTLHFILFKVLHQWIN